MNRNRIYEILQNKEIREIYYEDKPVWVQEVNNDVAKIGFMDGNSEIDVPIADLSEEAQLSNKNQIFAII